MRLVISNASRHLNPAPLSYAAHIALPKPKNKRLPSYTTEIADAKLPTSHAEAFVERRPLIPCDCPVRGF